MVSAQAFVNGFVKGINSSASVCVCTLFPENVGTDQTCLWSVSCLMEGSQSVFRPRRHTKPLLPNGGNELMVCVTSHGTATICMYAVYRD